MLVWRVSGGGVDNAGSVGKVWCAMSEWISVDDRLPDLDTGVIGFYRISSFNWILTVCIRNDSGFQTVDFWMDDIIHDLPITHWMPFPEPPKE
jgi:hypothetical protein